MPATTFPQAQRPRGKHLHWLMRCKDSSTRTYVRASRKNEHIFAIMGTSETRADLARFLVIHLRRKRANTRRQNDRPSRAYAKGRIAFETAMRPWWLLGPQARQTASRDLPAGGCAEFRADRATSTLPKSRHRAWEPRCLGRWATCNKRWPRNSPGCRGARARARLAACHPRHAWLAAA